MTALISVNTDIIDPAKSTIIEIDLPEGFSMVYTGRVQMGDLWFHRCERVWRPLTQEMYDSNKKYDQLGVNWWCGIARSGPQVGKVCERCRHESAYKGERYCLMCGVIVIREGKRGEA
jgi:hypothetical protein